MSKSFVFETKYSGTIVLPTQLGHLNIFVNWQSNKKAPAKSNQVFGWLLVNFKFIKTTGTPKILFIS